MINLRFIFKKSWLVSKQAVKNCFIEEMCFFMYYILMKFKSIEERFKFFEKVSDSVSVSDSGIFLDSVSVETQKHGFGRSLKKS